MQIKIILIILIWKNVKGCEFSRITFELVVVLVFFLYRYKVVFFNSKSS